MASAARKHDRRRRLREVAYYSTGISVYATASILVALAVDDWMDTDTYFAATGLALFVLGLFLARRQGRLQEAMADLETEEKITVLLAHAAALRDDDKYAMGFNAVGDTLACLRILAFTTAETRGHCAAAACAAIDQLDKTVRERSPFAPEEIDRLITATGRVLKVIEGHSPGLRALLDPVKLATDRLLGTLGDHPRTTTIELEGSPISIACFTSALEDQVRVRLNFARLNEADFRCRLRVIRDPRGLAGWVSPWYLDANGNECVHTDEGARAVEIVRPDGSANPPPKSHAEHVASIAGSMKTGRAGPILIGGYSPFGRDVVVVIDGNHRVRAAVQSGHPLHIVALVLHGPDDPAILSDLTAA